MSAGSVEIELSRSEWVLLAQVAQWLHEAGGQDLEGLADRLLKRARRRGRRGVAARVPMLTIIALSFGCLQYGLEGDDPPRRHALRLGADLSERMVDAWRGPGRRPRVRPRDAARALGQARRDGSADAAADAAERLRISTRQLYRLAAAAPVCEYSDAAGPLDPMAVADAMDRHFGGIDE